MKFNCIFLIISFFLILSNIITKKFGKNNKINKSHSKKTNTIQQKESESEDKNTDLMLLEKMMELQPNSEKDNLKDDEDSSESEEEQENKEERFNTNTEGTKADEDDDEDEESREEEKKADLAENSENIDTALLETGSKLNSEIEEHAKAEAEALENYQNYVEKKIDYIARNQKDMIDESRIVQKKAVEMINEMKKNLED